MILLKINVLCLVLVASSTLAEYSSHESEEEDDAHYRDQPPVDYSQYFNGMGRALDPSTAAQLPNQSSGFVKPLDFADFFQNTQFGQSRGASTQLFQSPRVVLPLNVGGFSVQERNNTGDNPAGFVDDILFRSLFDTSGSASEYGYNSPSKLVDPELSYNQGFSYPGHASLQKDDDREVNYQRKQEDAVQRSRAMKREPDVREDEEDEDVDDFDSVEVDDFPSSNSDERSKNEYTKDEHKNKYGDVIRTSSRNPISQPVKLPHSSINQLYPIPNSDRDESKYRKPYTTFSKSEDDYSSSSTPNYDSDEHEDDNGSYPKPNLGLQKFRNNPLDTRNQKIPIKTFYHSLPINEKNLPSKNNDPYYLNHPRSQPNYPGYSSGLSYPVVKPTSYNSPQGAYYHTSSPYYNKPPSNFRPSPRDTYLDSIRNSPQRRALYYSSPVKPVIESRSHPTIQTDYATAIQKRTRIPVTKPKEPSGKSCKKVQKKMDDEELSRFKRQQMTCYICTNKEKGNTYEECSYESEPLGNSFYKGSAEAYSTETVLPKSTHHSRKRRSSNKYFESILTLSSNEETPLVRRIRQYHHGYDPDEQGHGPENYRFSPDYVQAKSNHPPDIVNPKRTQSVERHVPQPQGSRLPHKRRQNNKSSGKEKRRQRPLERIVYGEERRKKPQSMKEYRNYEHDDDYEDDTDIEKEYQPPGASDDDECQRVNKDGLVCMVCQNPKSGGTYEQCSYASDPEANRYEYSRQKTYGNPRDTEADRYKRYTVKSNSKLNPEPDEADDSYNKNTRNTNNGRNTDFKNGKLKRKKVRSNYTNKRPTAYPKNKRRKYDTSKEKKERVVVGLDPFFYGSSNKPYNPNDYDDRGRKLKRRQQDESYDDESGLGEDDSEEESPTYEESFFRLFPELVGQNPYTGESIEQRGKTKPTQGNTKKEVKEDDDDYRHPEVPSDDANDEEESESKQSSNKVQLGFEYGIDMPTLYFDEDESKKDLEKALDEFKQKNRSDCKKVIKDEMTCYQCLDKNNMQQEECMFVAETEPKSKHLAYHEVKQFRLAPENNVTDNSTVQDSKVPLLNNSHGIRSRSNLENHNKYKHPITPHSPLESTSTKRKLPTGIKGLVNSSTGKSDHRKKPLSLNLDSVKVKIKHNAKNKGVSGAESQVIPTEVPMILSVDSERQPALIFDILKINPKSSESIPQTSNRQTPLQRRKRKQSIEDASPSERGSNNNQDTNEEGNATRRENSSDQNSNDEEQEDEEPPDTRPRYNSVPDDPEGFQIREGPEGAYSHETEPVFDPVLKISLPKYMLTRSEHERVFDEVLRSG